MLSGRTLETHYSLVTWIRFANSILRRSNLRTGRIALTHGRGIKDGDSIMLWFQSDSSIKWYVFRYVSRNES